MPDTWPYDSVRDPGKSETGEIGERERQDNRGWWGGEGDWMEHKSEGGPADCTDRLEDRAETRSFVCAIPPPWTSFRTGTLKLYDPGGILQGSRSASYKIRLVLRCHTVD